MSISQHLASATDIEHWATRRDAQGTLPKLVRRLIAATAPSAVVGQMRADEGVQLPGWDGMVSADQVLAGIRVPQGPSVWEMGTSSDIRAKANDDYAKRSGAPQGIHPQGTTFVFVTPRRWRDKDAWCEEKKAEGTWRDVQVLDADDLETWLERAPGVHLWFTEKLGKPTSGARPLQVFCEGWLSATNPPLSNELLTGGRQASIEKLGTWLRSAPSVCELRSQSAQEVVAFLGAVIKTLGDEQDSVAARGVVVTSADAWDYWANQAVPLLLVPLFGDRSRVTAAVQSGHHVLVALGSDEFGGPSAIELEKLGREQTKKALENMGLPEGKVDELAPLARVSLSAFRRRLAVSRAVMTPAWARSDQGAELLPALLAGRWQADNPADQAILAKLSGQPYEQYERILEALSRSEDPPFRRVGQLWAVVSKDDAWELLVRYVKRSDLERFLEATVGALRDRDPRHALGLRALLERESNGRTWFRSDVLRDGLADTLILLGTTTVDLPDHAGGEPKYWARRAVRDTLRGFSELEDWENLAPVLPSLAEASPETFLEAVAHGLKEYAHVFADLLADGRRIFAGSPHTHLLWALELLAWSPDLLSDASLALGRLARLDPGGRLSNRPAASLRDIFLLWHPGTEASPVARLGAIDRLRQREPEVAWELMVGLMPSGREIAIPTHKPRRREVETPRVTHIEYAEAALALLSRLVEDAGESAARWATLVGFLDDVSEAQFDSLLAGIDGLVDRLSDDASRVPVWSALRELISRHRRFPELDWSMDVDRLDRLEALYHRFEPKDPIARYAWLFSGGAQLLEGVSDYKEHDRVAEQKRQEAVEGLLRAGGLDLVRATAERVPFPQWLGSALARSSLGPAIEDEVLDHDLGSENANRREMALRVVQHRYQLEGANYLARVRGSARWHGWSDLKKSDFFLGMPFEIETWDTLATEGDAVARLYWETILLLGHGRLEPFVVGRVVTEMRRHGQLARAVEFLRLYMREAGVGDWPPALVSELLEEIAQSDLSEIDWTRQQYDFAELLEKAREEEGVSHERMVALEWAFLPLLPYRSRPQHLFKELANSSDFFMTVMKSMYRTRDELGGAETDRSEASALHVSRLLHEWDRIPGTRDDGIIDAQSLRTWAEAALSDAERLGIHVFAESHIGSVLAHAPRGEDGAWPHEAVRDLIEHLEDLEFERAIEIGVFNNRGMVSKAMLEGGRQERTLEERYRAYAETTRDGWPRCSRMLARIGASYGADGRSEDTRAEVEEELWR